MRLGLKLGLGLVLSLSVIEPLTAQVFTPQAYYQVCFSPEGNCTQLLVQQIYQAKQSIQIQAFSLTSYPILKALIKAKQRGVLIQVIADPSQFDARQHSLVPKLRAAGIPVWKDDDVHLAHNKVMIFDGATIETGSFNYTVSADRYNAENMLIIHDADLAKIYVKNFENRLAASKSI